MKSLLQEDLLHRLQMKKESDNFDYKGFLDALKFIGCERVSIEAGTSDFASDAVEAIRVLNKYK